MTDFLYKTIATLDSALPNETDPEWINFVAGLQPFIQRMIREGKTDGWIDGIQQDGKTITARYWIDEAAAQEWVDFASQIPIYGKYTTFVIETVAS